MIEYYGLHQHSAYGHADEPNVSSFHFPGGEVQIEIGDQARHHQVAYCRYGGDADIVELAMWADAMKRQNRKTLLLLPYLPGARMDRGVPLGAKVYADLINSMGIDKIVALDPHSDVAPALYDRLSIMPLTRFLAPLADAVIAPDAGASKRAEDVAQHLKVPVYYAGKKRDFKTGKLSGFKCEDLPKFTDGGRVPKFLLVDDICDGGGTFIGLADHLYETQGITGDQLKLWVTHGIFSKGLGELRNRFGWIGTTDSHEGSDRILDIPKVEQLRRVPLLKSLIQFATEGR